MDGEDILAEIITLPKDGDRRRHVLKRRRFDSCQHGRIIVDEAVREVTCAKCGAKLDAFSILLDYAKRDDRAWMTWLGLVAKTKSLREKKDKLESEVRNLKATVRRWREKGASSAQQVSLTVRESESG